MSGRQNYTGHGDNSKAGYRRKKFFISSRWASAVVAALAMVAELAGPWFSQSTSSAAINTADVDNSRIGTLTLQTDENECDLMKLDNETGRTIENNARCRKNVTLDAHGHLFPWARFTASIRSANPSWQASIEQMRISGRLREDFRQVPLIADL